VSVWTIKSYFNINPRQHACMCTHTHIHTNRHIFVPALLLLLETFLKIIFWSHLLRVSCCGDIIYWTFWSSLVHAFLCMYVTRWEIPRMTNNHATTGRNPPWRHHHPEKQLSHEKVMLLYFTHLCGTRYSKLTDTLLVFKDVYNAQWTNFYTSLWWMASD
jgi:hypothetical protein